MTLSQHRIEFDELRRAHATTVECFPHEYLDQGLGVIGLFLHDPPKNAGYRTTPINSITFASIGVDGIHLGSISETDRVDPMSPVVVTIPMAFDSPNFIVGETLYDFLCLGCRNGYANLANLETHFDDTMVYYQNIDDNYFDERLPLILQTLSQELALDPWPDVRGHFADLQSRFLPTLRLSLRS